MLISLPSFIIFLLSSSFSPPPFLHICSTHFPPCNPSLHPPPPPPPPHYIPYLFFSFLIPSHIIASHFIASHTISSHTISYHRISYHLISYHLISYHLISSHLISYFLFLRLEVDDGSPVSRNAVSTGSYRIFRPIRYNCLSRRQD